ncbi:hypothetical protein [Coxiella-like endosymbiont of Rhipicephalus sanguineus]|uniref:hypothetical protein n=1 Tax=Coxiella-like endosymbiont of Rhipicephalus sanguineus TaxID=1955402 RepID=UPI0020425F93|nr:hypothetical protein [Coxiella-like endosymbiont of Rhipicephalus sanguineus]
MCCPHELKRTADYLIISLYKTYSPVNRPHYPTPYAIVDNWMKSGVSQDPYLTEAKSIVKLMLIENSSYDAGVMGRGIPA